MTSLRKTSRVGGYLAIACLMAFSAYAATIDATKREGYGRVIFPFEQATRLKTSSNGTTATLTFNNPLNQSPYAIQAKLPGYVTDAKLSADKRTLTLTMNKPYRLRQFVSGNKVGIDLMGDPTKVKEKKPEEPIKTASAKETDKKSVPANKAAKKSDTPNEAVVANEAIMSTKKVVKEALKAKEAATETAMLSTKAQPHAEEPATQSTPEQAAEAERTKTPEPEAKENLPEAAATPEEEAPKPVVKASDKSLPFVVSARSVNGETVLNFPWKERTAAATFTRANDIWIVFSRPENLNVSLLRTVMPKQVVNVIQYPYKGNSVLRLITDGSISAEPTQIEGGYGWNITLTKSPNTPALDTTIASDSLEDNTRIVLGIYDIAPELRFFDPNAGDGLIIIPSYENRRGVAKGRNFAGFDILPSSQGVAMVNRLTDLTTTPTRSGVVLSSIDGLPVSEILPQVTGTTPVMVKNSATGIMIPYDQWFVPKDKFLETQMERLRAVAASTKATKADSLMELAKLYLIQGMGAEAGGYLDVIKAEFPDYYVANKLALLRTAAYVMNTHMDEATREIAAPELIDSDEAMLWKQVTSLHTAQLSVAQAIEKSLENSAQSTAMPVTPIPANDAVSNIPGAATTPTNVVAPEASFQFLKYNKPYIRFYPPAIRQRLSAMAAQAYIKNGEYEKALAVFDTLLRDNIIGPLTQEAEYTLGVVAEKKGEAEQALEIYGRLAKQTENPRVSAQARLALAKLQLAQGSQTPEAAAEALEHIRMAWRGDDVERAILQDVIGIYTQTKRYDEVLRARRALQTAFPNDAESLTNMGEMTTLFEEIFSTELGNDMPPLKALSLFYEFRELTPLGEKGDLIVQNLANRLAAIDLLSRATQLLEHQVKYRSTGAVRSRIGARLALLYLLNRQPQEALTVLEVTNFGDNEVGLQIQRQQLTALALTKLNKNEEALSVIYNDTTAAGALLRLDILWAMQDWPNIANRAEDILTNRSNLTDPLSNQETEVLLKLALAYTFESDYVQLRYLRDYYSGLIPDTASKQIFEYITNDTTPLDPEDFALVAQQISRTESFLNTFKEKIMEGKLSEAIR